MQNSRLYAANAFENKKKIQLKRRRSARGRRRENVKSRVKRFELAD